MTPERLNQGHRTTPGIPGHYDPLWPSVLAAVVPISAFVFAMVMLVLSWK